MPAANSTTRQQATMKTVLSTLGISQRELARRTKLSKSAVHRLVAHGEWPAQRAAAVRGLVADYLRERGAEPLHLRVLPKLPRNEMAPVSRELTGADREDETTPTSATPTPTETEMLLRHESLTPQARKAFSLFRNPFADDVQHRDDVFVSPGIRYVRAALMDAAANHGFIAIVGESGSGKSTIVEEFEERVRAEGKDVMVIKPYTLAMELNDVKGKTLKSGAIAESIARALDPNIQLKSSPQSRFEQVHTLLKASRKAGRRHVLVIEEAHCLPVATLKHLKRFTELKDGLQRLVGIVLVAQPELAERLSSQNAEVREVMQRCEIVQMEPLDSELENYLKHKLGRSDVKLDAVFAPDAADAIRARLVHVPRGGKPSDAVSVCFPLVVNNLVCRAMNAAARAGWPKVDASVIAGC